MTKLMEELQAEQQAAYDRLIGHDLVKALHDDGSIIRVLFTRQVRTADGRKLEGLQASYGIQRCKRETFDLMFDNVEAYWVGNHPNQAKL